MMADGPHVGDVGIIDRYSLFEWQRNMVAIVTTLLKIVGSLFYKRLAIIGLAINNAMTICIIAESQYYSRFVPARLSPGVWLNRLHDHLLINTIG